MAVGARAGRPGAWSLAAAGALVAIAVGWAAALPHDGIGNGLAIILALCAALGSLTAAQWQGAMDVSASFVCVMLAAAYLGPAEAFAVVVFSESVAWLSQRYRPQALVVNLAAIGIPALIAGTLMDALVTDATSRVEFLAVLAAAAVINLTVNFVLACSLLALMDGLSLRQVLRPPARDPAVAGAHDRADARDRRAYANSGTAAALFIVLVIVAFTYMTQLVVIARERTRGCAGLSWGVLSRGYLRALDRRDDRRGAAAGGGRGLRARIALERGRQSSRPKLAHTAAARHRALSLPDHVDGAPSS